MPIPRAGSLPLTDLQRISSETYEWLSEQDEHVSQGAGMSAPPSLSCSWKAKAVVDSRLSNWPTSPRCCVTIMTSQQRTSIRYCSTAYSSAGPLSGVIRTRARCGSRRSWMMLRARVLRGREKWTMLGPIARTGLSRATAHASGSANLHSSHCNALDATKSFRYAAEWCPFPSGPVFIDRWPQ